jgi:hypothetical protein
MPQDTRVNFSQEIIDKVLEKQNKACAKCGLPLTFGFDAHHADGDNSNASEENCQLLHPRCHDSEQWRTLKTQKEKVLGQIDGLITQILSPAGLAGAIVKEAAGLIDKELTLQGQLFGLEHYNLPQDQQQAYQEAAARDRLEAYQQGVMDTIREGIPSMLSGTVAKVKLSAKQ